MTFRKTNINSADYKEEGVSERDGATGRTLDLSGDHLGVRIEEGDAGGTSSYHHYHTAEEEHVIVLKGVGTLHLGTERIDLSEGDHIWFPAGEDTAHHLENTSTKTFCAECGSNLWGAIEFGLISVAAGTLDNPNLFEPTKKVFVDDAPHWARVPNEVEEM